MTQSFLEMGERPVFPVSIENWAERPKLGIDFGLSIFRPGGPEYIKKTKQNARSWQVSYTAQGSDLSELLFFFASQRGRFKSFWWPAPNYLQNPVFIDDTSIKADGDLEDMGIEYLYIITSDHEVGRRVLTTTYVPLNDSTTFTFAQIAIEDIELETISYCRELVFVTFGTDILEINYRSGDLAEASITFVEVFGEKESFIGGV